MTLILAPPVLFALAAAGVTTLGFALVLTRAGAHTPFVRAFELAAAGMLLTLCAVHIVPEALALSQHGLWLVSAGFVTALLITLAGQRFAREGGAPELAAAIAPLVAIALHSTLDGVLYAVSFEADYASGVFAASALMLHEVPEGAVALAILLRHQVRLPRAVLIAFLVAALTTPFGALISAPLTGLLGAERTAMLYALSAGLLLFMATGPMLAPLRQAPLIKGVPALAAGVALAFVLHLAMESAGGHHAAHSAHVQENH